MLDILLKSGLVLAISSTVTDVNKRRLIGRVGGDQTHVEIVVWLLGHISFVVSLSCHLVISIRNEQKFFLQEFFLG